MMKILAVHHRLPYPLISGMDKVRYNLIRTLGLKHEVTLLAPLTEAASAEDVAQVRKICKELILLPEESNLARLRRSRWLYLRRLGLVALGRVPTYITNHTYPSVTHKVHELLAGGDFDLFQPLSDVTSGYLAAGQKARLTVLGPLDDTVESIRTTFGSEANFRQRIMWELEYRARRYYQPRVCKSADWALFFSPADLERIAGLAGGLPHARVLPVAVEAEDAPLSLLENSLALQEPGSLIFVGGLGPFFNLDAVVYFLREVFPLILAQEPGVKLTIVGDNPPERVLQMARGLPVFVTGRVPDVRPYIERAAVYVAPIRSGTGLKTKIIEAMNMGKAIVTTHMSLLGLWDLEGEPFMIADAPSTFASAVLELLRNPAQRVDLGRRARALYERSYAFDAVSSRTLAVYEEIEKSIR